MILSIIRYYWILLDRSEYYGIKDYELKYLASYLHNRAQCCNVNEFISSIKRIICGVPQDPVLGPLVFSIHINDLPSIVDVDIALFSDYTTLFKACTATKELSEQFIPTFAKACEWLKCYKLSRNTIKTEFMLIGTAQKLN